MDRLSVDQVVGHVEQGADVTSYWIRTSSGISAWVGRRPPENKSTLRAGRDDDRVLGDLGLHQTEHLGAVVLTPIRPANATAGHGTAARDGCPRSPSPYTKISANGTGCGMSGTSAEPELERQHWSVGLEGVGSQGRFDQSVEAAQDPVVIERWDGVEAFDDRLFERESGRPRRGPDQTASRTWQRDRRDLGWSLRTSLR